MRLKNILLVVNDIETSKAFYKEFFGLTVMKDFGENIMLSEGLVLQERKIWEALTGKQAAFGGHDAELFFEETDFNAFMEKLEQSSLPIEYISKPAENSWGRRVIRLYDPDKHVIEIGEK